MSSHRRVFPVPDSHSPNSSSGSRNNLVPKDSKEKFKKRNRKKLMILLVSVIVALFIIVILFYVLEAHMWVKFIMKLDVCDSEECMRVAASLKETMNTSIDPCEDFYSYVCGRWPEAHPSLDLSQEHSWFREKAEKVTRTIRDLLVKNSTTQDLPWAVSEARTLFDSCMNVESWNELELAPLLELLEELSLPQIPAAISKVTSDFTTQMARTKRVLGIDVFFGMYITADPRDTSRNIIVFDLPERESPFPSDKLVDKRLKQIKNGVLEIAESVSESDNDESEETPTASEKAYIIEVFKQLISNGTTDQPICSSRGAFTIVPESDIEDTIDKMLELSKKFEDLEEGYNNRTSQEFDKDDMDIEDSDYVLLDDLQRITDEYIKSINDSLQPKMFWRSFVDEVLDGIVESDPEQKILISDLDYFKDVALSLASTEEDLLETVIWWTVVNYAVPYSSQNLRRIWITYVEKVLGSGVGRSRSIFCAENVEDLMDLELQSTDGIENQFGEHRPLNDSAWEISHGGYDHEACDPWPISSDDVFLQSLISTGESESRVMSDDMNQGINGVDISSSEEQKKVRETNQSFDVRNEGESIILSDKEELDLESFRWREKEDIEDKIDDGEMIESIVGNSETSYFDMRHKTYDESECLSSVSSATSGPENEFGKNSFDEWLREIHPNGSSRGSSICELNQNTAAMKVGGRKIEEKKYFSQVCTEGREINKGEQTSSNLDMESSTQEEKTHTSNNLDYYLEKVRSRENSISAGQESEIFSDSYIQWKESICQASSPKKIDEKKIGEDYFLQKRKAGEDSFIASKKRKSGIDSGGEKLYDSFNPQLHERNDTCRIETEYLGNALSSMDYQNKEGTENHSERLSEITFESVGSKTSVEEGFSERRTLQDSNTQIHAEKTSSVTDYSQSEDDEVKKIRNWMVSRKIPHNHGDELLKILRERKMPNLPASTKTFLKKKSIFIAEVMDACDGSQGEFIYIGLKNKLQATIEPSKHPDKVAELAFGVDGFNPFKSSKCTVWPILCKVYKREYNYKIFTVAVYAGKSKPKCANEFLRKFVEELNNLLKNGIEINGVIFKIKIKFFICDTPARAFLKLWIGHSSLIACERCFVVGKKVNGVTVFLETDALRRTGLSFRTFAQPECHHGVSLLIILEELDPVYHFILDPMHSIYLGPAKRVLDYLLGEPKKKISEGCEA